MSKIELLRLTIPTLLIGLALLGLYLNREKTPRIIKETFLNISVFLGLQIVLIFFKAPQAFLYTGASEIRLLNIPDNVVTFAVTFILVDLIYYWVHRISHTFGFMWAVHSVHHSSKEFNFSTALRLPWLAPLFNWVFFIPLVIVGLPLKFVVISHLFNLWFQYFIHTKAVGKLGFIDKIFNSPSNHRVHHSSQKEYINKNFGGVFMFWDHLFRTYKKEGNVTKYGVGGDERVTYNPVIINFSPMRDYFRNLSK